MFEDLPIGINQPLEKRLPVNLLSPSPKTQILLEQSIPCPTVELQGHMTVKDYMSSFSIATVVKERCKRKTESYYKAEMHVLSPPIKDRL